MNKHVSITGTTDGADVFSQLRNIVDMGEEGYGPLSGLRLIQARELAERGLVVLEDFGDGPVATATEAGREEVGK